MVIGVMQPYFFPYVGYFSLIEYSDQMIFFDTPQYIKHGWVNRNRILGQDGEATYIVVPTHRAVQSIPIKEVQIDYNQRWREKIYGQLTVYKKRAPRYKDTIDFVHSLLDEDYDESLSKLNIYTIEKVCKRVGIQSSFKVFSQMGLEIDSVEAPDEWALKISKAICADEYVNPPGGKRFFDERKYVKEGIKLSFLESNLPQYIQRIGKWVPGLSIIDVMMFCSDAEIKDIIKDYRFI